MYYDPLNRLTEYDTTVSTRAYYSGPDMVAEVSNPTSTVLRRFVPGPGTDEPVVWYEGSGTTDRRFLQADERGSIVAVSDSSGNAIGINRYDEYGIPAASNIGRFQYTGQRWYPELGMYDYKARIYSPTLGRFMQTDPIGYDDGMNWYNYVHADPVNGVDPSGLAGDTTAGCVRTYSSDVECYTDNDIVVTGHRIDPLNIVRDELHILELGRTNLPPFFTPGAGVAGAAAKNEKAHKYTIKLVSPCPAKSVFDYFKGAGHSAPGAPAASDGTRNLILTGNNPISQYVNSSTGTIVNTTLRGHEFYPGTVTIQVSPLGRETSTITITGEGTGGHPILNDFVGEAWFGGTANGASDACGR